MPVTAGRFRRVSVCQHWLLQICGGCSQDQAASVLHRFLPAGAGHGCGAVLPSREIPGLRIGPSRGAERLVLFHAGLGHRGDLQDQGGPAHALAEGSQHAHRLRLRRYRFGALLWIPAGAGAVQEAGHREWPGAALLWLPQRGGLPAPSAAAAVARGGSSVSEGVLLSAQRPGLEGVCLSCSAPRCGGRPGAAFGGWAGVFVRLRLRVHAGQRRDQRTGGLAEPTWGRHRWLCSARRPAREGPGDLRRLGLDALTFLPSRRF
mmetsp:Transcript_1873/g.4406  ORF Transcript_1873/g.4406 Transcript_1873/m.4406 type:complete len:262 (-) Transcript_1873:129-914(-)